MLKHQLVNKDIKRVFDFKKKMKQTCTESKRSTASLRQSAISQPMFTIGVTVRV